MAIHKRGVIQEMSGKAKGGRTARGEGGGRDVGGKTANHTAHERAAAAIITVFAIFTIITMRSQLHPAVPIPPSPYEGE